MTHASHCTLCNTRTKLIIKHSSGDILKCTQCGLIFRKRDTTQVIEHYIKAPFSAPDPTWVEARRKAYTSHMDLLESYRKNNTILDIGSGSVFFLHDMKKRGWDTLGIELGKDAAAYARNRFNLNIIETPLEELNPPPLALDAITLWNVLDEVTNPLQLLQHAHQALRNEGLLVVRLPNALFHVPAYRIFSLIQHVRLIHKNPATIHQYSFSPKTLSLLLKSAGFSNIRIKNAALSWSTDHKSTDTANLRQVSAQATQATNQLISTVTKGRILTAPSLVAIAEKN